MRLQRLFLQGGILSLLVCALAAPAASEESGKITGVITDKRNGEPLLGAHIPLVLVAVLAGPGGTMLPGYNRQQDSANDGYGIARVSKDSGAAPAG